jgi:hypothetical protein
LEQQNLESLGKPLEVLRKFGLSEEDIIKKIIMLLKK